MGRNSGWLLRKLFGKQEGEKLFNAQSILFGLIGLVVCAVIHDWWYMALAGLVVLLSGTSLLRERRQRPDPSDDHGLVGEVVAYPRSLNPFHHEPVPPFPGTPEEEPK
jgi:hypothetical protein